MPLALRLSKPYQSESSEGQIAPLALIAAILETDEIFDEHIPEPEVPEEILLHSGHLFAKITAVSPKRKNDESLLQKIDIARDGIFA